MLQDYHQGWGELRISAEPANPVNLMGLMLSPPTNWQSQLGIRVKLNQREITDLSFDMRQLDAGELAVLMGEEPPPKSRKPQDRYRYVYRDAPVAALAEHLGAEVRLHLNNEQPMRAGTLQAVEGGEARVEQFLFGGKMTAHVTLDEIVRLEVRPDQRLSAAP